MDKPKVFHTNGFVKLTKLLLSSAIFLSVIWPFPAVVGAQESSGGASHVNEIYQLIERYHVSGISEKNLAASAINGMITTLDDPHTQYLPKQAWEQFQGSLEKSYVGIGISIGEDDHGFYAVEVFPHSPAEGAGLKQGDYITAVEGRSTTGFTSDQLVSSITGVEGTKVKVIIRRNQQSWEVEITRNKIQLPVVTSELFIGGVGYIRIASFSSTAAELFSSALLHLQEQGMRSLVVDLRNNPGGLLLTAAHIAGQFMEEGTLIHTKDRDLMDNPVSISDGKTFPYPLVLLVNENSASASEVLMGALQDYNLAIVVGNTTYGKGSVQNIFQLSDGGVLKLTVEEYLTPKGRPVNGAGLEPDIEVYGETAQLVKALHATGMHDLNLTVKPTHILVNGVEFQHKVKLIQDKESTYVSSRLLAAIIDGEVRWDPQLQTIFITQGHRTASFPVSTRHVIMNGGTSYIELAYFQEYFPHIRGFIQGESFILSTKGEN